MFVDSRGSGCVGPGGGESTADAHGFVSLNPLWCCPRWPRSQQAPQRGHLDDVQGNPEGIVETGGFPAFPLPFRRH